MSAASAPLDVNGLLRERGDGKRLFGATSAMTKQHASRGVVWVSSTVAIVVGASHAHAVEARYACNGGTKLTAAFSPPSLAAGSVALTFADGRKMVLPQVMSADGGRYADSHVEFWIKGRNATLTRDGHAETCSTR